MLSVLSASARTGSAYRFTSSNMVLWSPRPPVWDFLSSPPALRRGFAKGGRAPMVPFPLSRSPHPSSGPFPTYRKPARPAPPGRAAQRLAKRLRCSGLPRGRFYFLPAAPVPARCNPFCFWRRGSFCAAAPAYRPAGSFPFLAAPFRPPPPKKARRGGAPPFTARLPQG